jgi:hypothetical protein
LQARGIAWAPARVACHLQHNHSTRQGGILMLRWNMDNHIAMQRRMLVPFNGVLISNKEVFLQYEGIACVMQRNASHIQSKHSSRCKLPFARHSGVLLQSKGILFQDIQRMLMPCKGMSVRGKGFLLITDKRTRHRGVLVLHEGMLPAIKGTLW